MQTNTKDKPVLQGSDVTYNQLFTDKLGRSVGGSGERLDAADMVDQNATNQKAMLDTILKYGKYDPKTNRYWGYNQNNELFYGGIGQDRDGNPEVKALLWSPYENLLGKFIKSAINIVTGDWASLAMQVGGDMFKDDIRVKKPNS